MERENPEATAQKRGDKKSYVRSRSGDTVAGGRGSINNQKGGKEEEGEATGTTGKG